MSFLSFQELMSEDRGQGSMLMINEDSVGRGGGASAGASNASAGLVHCSPSLSRRVLSGHLNSEFTLFRIHTTLFDHFLHQHPTEDAEYPIMRDGSALFTSMSVVQYMNSGL